MKYKLTFTRIARRDRVEMATTFDASSDEDAKRRVKDISIRQCGFYFKFVKLEKENKGN